MLVRYFMFETKNVRVKQKLFFPTYSVIVICEIYHVLPMLLIEPSRQSMDNKNWDSIKWD